MVVKLIDQRRSEREAWHAVLNDFVGANQAVMLARLRLSAHRSALTYQEQLAEFMRARVELRRIRATGMVMKDPRLAERITSMLQYLDELGREYEKGYLKVARQQRLDELWLTDKMKAASDGIDAPVLPDELANPTRAWRLLHDPARFPRLAALLDQHAFQIDAFHVNYEFAKEYLEVHAGFGDRSALTLAESARKLSERAEQFVLLHSDLPAEIVTRMRNELDLVTRARNSGDGHAIDDATVRLNTTTVAAINAVYVARESVTAAPPSSGDG
jgi:hypothetical protein